MGGWLGTRVFSNVFFTHFNSFGKFGPPYLGSKVTAAARADLNLRVVWDQNKKVGSRLLGIINTLCKKKKLAQKMKIC